MYITVDCDGDSTCVSCGAPLCSGCNQVLEAYRREDGTVGRRHERNLVAPRCPAYKAEMVEYRRSHMRLIQGGAA